MKRRDSEKLLERRLKAEVEARGGIALKFTSQFHRGIPDRICLLPGGRIFFVELKTTGEKPTALQSHEMGRLRALDFTVDVVASFEDLNALTAKWNASAAK